MDRRRAGLPGSFSPRRRPTPEARPSRRPPPDCPGGSTGSSRPLRFAARKGRSAPGAGPSYGLPGQSRMTPRNSAVRSGFGRKLRIWTGIHTRSSAPAFEVMFPPSKPATTDRRSTASNSNSFGVHSVCIGAHLGSWSNRCDTTILSDSQPRCTSRV